MLCKASSMHYCLIRSDSHALLHVSLFDTALANSGPTLGHCSYARLLPRVLFVPAYSKQLHAFDAGLCFQIHLRYANFCSCTCSVALHET